MDIHVRKMNFAFEGDFSILPDVDDRQGSCILLGVSFTLPYLEPYLIRTMRAALKHISDPQIAADVRAFSGQEGQHYQNHALINDKIRARLSPQSAAQIAQIEGELKADYARLSRDKSLKFNLAYAEGFEAMTLAFVMAGITDGHERFDPAWRELLEWHGAEEVEHRTVAFDAYHHLYGSYPYRVARGLWAQIHYMGYIRRFAKVMAEEFSHVPKGKPPPSLLRALPAYLGTFSPFYNPARITPSDYVRRLLEKYDARAAEPKKG